MKIFVSTLIASALAIWSVSAAAQAPAPATTNIRVWDVESGEVVPYVIRLTVSESAADSPQVGATVAGVPINLPPHDGAIRDPMPPDAVPPPPAALVSAPRDDELHDRLAASRNAAGSAPPAGVKLIAAPQITLLPAETATLEITASQTFTYLESAEAGRYVAKRSEPKKLGLNIKLKAEPSQEDEKTVLCRLECEMSALVGREPVNGLDLEVGKPIVSTWSLKTTAATKLGDRSLVFLPSGPNRTCLLTVEVTKAEPAPDGSKVLPNPPPKQR
jgi:hypothetical protein